MVRLGMMWPVRNDYRGPAVVTAVPRKQSVRIPVTVDLCWGSAPFNADRTGRLSGTLEPAGAETALLPTGKVVLRLPDGYQATGQLAALALRSGSWYAFAGPAPYFPAIQRGLEGHFLVTTGYTPGWQGEVSSETIIEAVTGRVGITVTRTGSSWFCADLTDAERVRVRWELGVAYVEQEIEGHPAPCFRGSPPDAIEGEFFVNIREGVDPGAAAARLGVDNPLHVFTNFSSFGARLTDAEIDRIRHDPDVVDLRQNSRVYLDD
jgi:Peptidase inhibitor I9